MRIVRSYNEPIRACCQFEYKNYEISVSNLLNIKRIEVAIFALAEPNKLIKEFYTVEEAINWIDNQ